jgi:hypothetical protein
VIAALDAINADDVQRVAREVIGERALHLALIGPFEDGETFARLLA